MKTRVFFRFGVALAAAAALRAQTLPTAPTGTDPVHNSPLTLQDFAWFTGPGFAVPGPGDYTQATMSESELADAMVPTDPSVRYANFAPRIGTVLPTDDPKTWNWDRNDRAQMQDAYYQLLAPSWDEIPVWTNWVTNYTADSTAAGGYRATFHTARDFGSTDAAWRNAVYLHLNFARYLAFGANHVRYVSEDPKVLPWVQAAVYWLAGNDYTTHTPGTSTPFYSDLAYQGCNLSNLADDKQTVNACMWTYLVDPANYYPGHRESLMNDEATRVAAGSMQVDPAGIDKTWGSNALWVRDPEIAGASLERDPLKAVSVYPFAGYIPCALLEDASICNPTYDVMFSITFNGGNAILSDATVKNMTVTVTRNGVELPIKNPQWGNNTFFYTVNLAWDSTQTPGTAGYYTQLDPSGFGDDQTFVVTFHGIQFCSGQSYSPSGGWTDVFDPNDPDIDPIAYTTRDYSYTFTIFNPEKVQAPVYPTVPSAIVGISGRSVIGSGDQIEVAGFQISGTEPMRVAIRAQGPGLAAQGITNPAGGTMIKVYQITSDGTNPELGSNDGWKNGSNWRLLASYNLAPSKDNESAVVATLPPGVYTAEVSDPTNPSTPGVGIVEIYSADTVSTSQLTGISTRAVIGTGQNSLVAGFIITKPMTVMVRSQGPSLTKLGVTGAVAATKLTLVQIGSTGNTTLAVNSGWQDQTPGTENSRFESDLASQAPGSASEAAIIVHLQPGTYTAQVEAADGTPGVGIVEVYQEPN